MCLRSEAGDICVIHMRVSLTDTLRGKQIFYKYIIYSDQIASSVEFLFCKKPEEHGNCYRVFTLPWNKDGMYGCLIDDLHV